MAKIVMVCGAGGVSILAGVTSAPSAVLASPIASVEAQVTIGPVSADLSVTLKPLGQLGQLDRLNYAIRTHYNSGSGCAGERIRTARIGIPTPVDMGGSLLPDATVTLVALPGVGGSPDLLQLAVSKTAVGTLRGRIEVILAPDAADSGRVSFGYNACETGAPLGFSATIGATDARISLAATTSGPTAALTIIGSSFDDVGGVATDPTALALRLAPVPASMSANVDIVGPSSYKGTVKTSRSTKLRLGYSDVDEASRMNAVATIDLFPGQVDLTFSPDEFSYNASDKMNHVDFGLETYSPSTNSTPSRVAQLGAVLDGVPSSAKLQRLSPTRVLFTTPGTIASSVVRFASFLPGPAPATPAPLADQYLVADVGLTSSSAAVKILGLSRADIDAGDPLAGTVGADGEADKVPLVVDVTHTAGPFRINASVTKANAPPDPPGTTTRNVVGRVLKLPATAKITYGAKTQSFTYYGSDPITEMGFDVTSSVPITDDAKVAHLTVRNFPTGLRGRLNETGKSFTANVTEGTSIGSIEVQVTSGPDLKLPAGVDGLLVEDHDGMYTAFARVTGLESVTVAWGGVQIADVVRTPGRFEVHVHVDDPDTADPATSKPKTDLDLDIVVANLPGRARLEYAASKETDCPASPCPKTPSHLTFTGNGTVGLIDLDVVSAAKLIEGGDRNKGATELHGLLKNVPAGILDVVIDGEHKNMTGSLTNPASDFVIELEACSTGRCGTPVETLRLPSGDVATMDGLWLQDLSSSYHLFGRISGLSSATLNWSDNVIVKATKNVGPFDIVVDETKLQPIPGASEPSIYPSKTSVAIRHLPGTVDISYAKNTKSLTYHGSDVIGSIEAWHSVEPIRYTTESGESVLLNGLVDRATNAHALIQGLPKDITVNLTVVKADDETQSISATLTASPRHGVDPPPQPIGSINVELTSDESALSTPAVQSVPTMSTDDGAVLWDLDDGDTHKFEPKDDAFLMVVRVTQLRYFHFEKYLYGSDSNDEVLMAEADRASRKNIWVDIVKPSTEKFPRTLDGFGSTYRYEYLRMGMDVPPMRMKFEAKVERQSNDDFRTLLVQTYADASATSATVETDAGSESLSAYVAPVPAGASYGDAGVNACVSPKSMDCQPYHRVRYAEGDHVSVSLEVAHPVHIDVVRVERRAYAGQNGQTLYFFPEFHVHMDIEKFMQASKQVDYDYTNEYFLYVDTQGEGIQGDITQYSTGGPGGGTDLHVHLPAGTMAYHRWIKLEGPPRHDEILAYQVGNNPLGEIACPKGMDILVDAFQGIDVHIEDEFCPNPHPHNALDANGPAAQVSRSANNGQPVQYTFHVYGDGFAPTNCPGDFSWPPCGGSPVAIGRVEAGRFFPDGRFEIVSRTWLGPDHLVVVVNVSPSVELGNYAVWMDNPETSGTHYLETQTIDGADHPAFKVVA